MDRITDIFGPEGVFAKHFPGYEPREGQVMGAEAIVDALVNEMHAIIEAPCGIGKSVMYCVPALQDVEHRPYDVVTTRTEEGDEEEDEVRRTIVVSTANTSLQDQLVQKDLPLLQKVLPWKFSFDLLKGRSNYLCLDQLQTAKAAGLDLPGMANRAVAQAVMDWAEVTKTGDRNEIMEPVDKVWSDFSVSGEECVGSKCFLYGQCFYEEAKLRAKNVKILVTNHALLAVHLKLFQDTGMHLLLPRFSVLVVDEAHELARYARKMWGFQLSHGSVLRALAPWRQVVSGEVFADILTASEKLFTDLYYLASAAKEPRIEPGSIPRGFGRLEELLGVVEKEAERLAPEGDPRLAKGKKRAQGLRERLVRVQKPSDDFVYWLEASDERRLASLCAEPLEVGDELRKALFEKVPTVVVTSATLTSGGSGEAQWSYLEREIGLVNNKNYVLPSPFDLSEQLRVYVPGVPLPGAPGRDDALVKTVEAVILQAEGRTLALFTSFKVMNYVHEKIVERGRVPYRVLKQRDAPVPRLVEQFREDVGSVLFGVASLWTGIDVPGEALSCVVVDRLPFTPHTDPVISAYRAKYGSACFELIQVPEAVIRFRQGVGRLIRTRKDRGVIVVMDSRIQLQKYGRKFLALGANIRLLDSVRGVGRHLRATS